MNGWLCPIEDEDWYSFELGASDHLVSVDLCVGDCQPDSISPVEATYVIHTREADGSAGQAQAAPAPEAVGGALSQVHCMAPGPYYLVVRDQNGDAQDIRRPYHLKLTTAADPDGSNEPNDDAASAGALAVGASTTGTIACSGDTDWYSITVPSGNVLRVTLDVPVSRFQPTVQVEDAAGNIVATMTNPAGAVRATALAQLIAVPAAGNYFLVVSDDDNHEADPDVPYSLAMNFVPDNDNNEPNNQPGEATPLQSTSCGAAWSSEQVFTGTFGAAGDNDWFRLPLVGCTNGVIEASVEMDVSGLSNAEAWTLAQEVQASVALIRPHGKSPCANDSQCQRLNQNCQDNFDCSGFFNACLPDGFCAGAAVCLEGVCGATEIQRQFQPGTPGTGAPPPNRAVASAPIFGDDTLYLKVADYQSNGAAPDVPYTLRVRIRRDPDIHEPSNVYTHRIEKDDRPSLQFSKASGIPVHDCTSGDCCSASTWVEGALSYEMDQDWYTYQHPCPGSDCTLRIAYDLDGGPSDFFFAVYRDRRLWFDSLVPLGSGTQGAIAGHYGGMSPGDTCFYGYRNHGSYGLQIRDLQRDGSQWSSDQHYRFCLEKVSNICEEPPCKIWTNAAGADLGCGQP